MQRHAILNAASQIKILAFRVDRSYSATEGNIDCKHRRVVDQLAQGIELEHLVRATHWCLFACKPWFVTPVTYTRQPTVPADDSWPGFAPTADLCYEGMGVECRSRERARHSSSGTKISRSTRRLPAWLRRGVAFLCRLWQCRGGVQSQQAPHWARIRRPCVATV